jgi:hypothetical protein
MYEEGLQSELTASGKWVARMTVDGEQTQHTSPALAERKLCQLGAPLMQFVSPHGAKLPQKTSPVPMGVTGGVAQFLLSICLTCSVTLGCSSGSQADRAPDTNRLESS